MSPSKIKLAKEEKKRLRELKKEHRKELERLRESQNAQIAKVRRQAITRPARGRARSTRSCVVFTPAPLQKKTCKNQTPARAAASPRRRGGSEDGWTEGGEVETWMTRMDVDARRSVAVRRAGVARVACLTDARRAPTVLWRGQSWVGRRERTSTISGALRSGHFSCTLGPNERRRERPPC